MLKYIAQANKMKSMKCNTIKPNKNFLNSKH